MLGKIIAIAAIILIIGGAIAYIIKAKKSGKKCIGCPYGDSCGKSCSGSCSGRKTSCSCSNTAPSDENKA